jgi:hypothetical protein
MAICRDFGAIHKEWHIFGAISNFLAHKWHDLQESRQKWHVNGTKMKTEAHSANSRHERQTPQPPAVLNPET